MNKYGYCPLCDEEMCFKTDDIIARCQKCGHHLNLFTLDEIDVVIEEFNSIPLVNPVFAEELRSVL